MKHLFPSAASTNKFNLHGHAEEKEVEVSTSHMLGQLPSMWETSGKATNLPRSLFPDWTGFKISY